MRIIHPRPEPGRQTQFDVEFIDGLATVESLHPERELAFRQHGFTIEADLEIETPFQEALGEPIVDLNALTIPQLRDIAGDRATIPPRAKKAEAVAIVAALPADPIPGDVPHPNGGFVSEGRAWADQDDMGGTYIPLTGGPQPAEIVEELTTAIGDTEASDDDTEE